MTTSSTLPLTWFATVAVKKALRLHCRRYVINISIINNTVSVCCRQTFALMLQRHLCTFSGFIQSIQRIPQCNNKGFQQCGICKCDEGVGGPFCNCTVSDAGVKSVDQEMCLYGGELCSNRYCRLIYTRFHHNFFLHFFLNSHALIQ